MAENEPIRIDDNDPDTAPSLDVTEVDAPEPTVAEEAEPIIHDADSAETNLVSRASKFQRLKSWFARHKKVTALLAVLFVVATLAAVPWTRYAIMGTFYRQSVTLCYTETATGKPVPGVDVVLGDAKGRTDTKGEVHLRPKVGQKSAVAAKKYYADSRETVFVPILKQKEPAVVHIKATGRQVPVKVINAITKAPITEATITALGTDTKTDAKGEAIIVLPADRQKVPAGVSAASFVKLNKDITVTETVVAENTFELVPEGYVYFLSNQDGTIDVVRAKVDGSGREVIIKGTGREQAYNTQMVASYDWRYIALLSRRDGGRTPKLFVIDTTTRTMQTVDSDEVDFNIGGWVGTTFAYQTSVYAANTQSSQVIKTYDAATRKSAVLAKSASAQADGSGLERFGNPFITGNDVVYTRTTDGPFGAAATAAVMAVKITGGDSRVVKEWNTASYVAMLRNGAQSVQFAVSRDIDNNLYTYKNGTVMPLNGRTAADVHDRDIYSYVLSPSGEKATYTDMRDGRTVAYTTSSAGDDAREIGTMESGYGVYGWVSDDYIVMLKENALYAISAKIGQGAVTPLRVSGFYSYMGQSLFYGTKD